MAGCGGLERTDFLQLIFWVGVVVFKELFLTVSTLGWCGGLERTEILQCLLWEVVVVLKCFLQFIHWWVWRC